MHTILHHSVTRWFIPLFIDFHPFQLVRRGFCPSTLPTNLKKTSCLTMVSQGSTTNSCVTVNDSILVQFFGHGAACWRTVHLGEAFGGGMVVQSGQCPHFSFNTHFTDKKGSVPSTFLLHPFSQQKIDERQVQLPVLLANTLQHSASGIRLSFAHAINGNQT